MELKVNTKKMSFFFPETEYLPTAEGIKRVQKKIQAVPDLQYHTTLKDMRSFLGMVQFYSNICKRRSHRLQLKEARGRAQRNCSTTEYKWLSIGEILNKFRSILFRKPSKCTQIIRTYSMNQN